MRVKNILLLALHGMCIGVILLLLGFIVWKKSTNQDSKLLSEFQIALEQSQQELQIIKEEQFKKIRVSSVQYLNKNDELWLNRAKWMYAKSDSMLVLVDSLQQKFNPNLLYYVQGQVSLYKNQAWATVENDTSMMHYFPSYTPDDWLFQSWKNDSPQKFATQLSVLKADIIEICSASMNYYAKRTGDEGMICCAGYDPAFSRTQINPRIGEQVSYDLSLNYFGCNKRYFTYRLNGKELTQKEGKVPFQIRFDKPGQYPLYFEVEERIQKVDSVQILRGEKTYYLNVQRIISGQ
jgi:hypothetical protein